MTSIKKIFSTLLFWGAGFVAIAQNEPSRCVKDIDLAQSVKNIQFFTYPSETKIGMSFKNLSEVKNRTPEELMASILCANSQAWVNFNELEPKEISKEKIENVNKAKRVKNYFHLLQKLEFETNGFRYAFIKFRLTFEVSTQALYMTETMIYQENHWKRINDSALTPIIFMLGMTQSSFLEAFFLAKPISNSTFQTMVEKSKIGKNINLNQFVKVTQEFASKEGMTKMQFMLEPSTLQYKLTPIFLNNFKEYKGLLLNVTFQLPLRNTTYCEYFDDETNKENDSTFFGKVVLKIENLNNIRDDSI